MNYSGVVSNSYASGNVDTYASYVGGLVGNSSSGTINNSYATGRIFGYNQVGGLAGNAGTVSNSFSTGDVDGVLNAGGLLGLVHDGTLSNSYSLGHVNGVDESGGGLVGNDNHQGYSFIKSFWDSDVNSSVNGIGNSIDPNIIGKTTAELKQQSTFTNWDFTETWGVEDNQTYPFLRLTYSVGDIDIDRDVDLLDFAEFAEHWLEDNGS